MLSRGLLLASANAYRALGVGIILSYVVSWSASCILSCSDKGLVRPSPSLLLGRHFPMTADVHRYCHRIGTSYPRVVSVMSVVFIVRSRSAF